MSKVAVIYWSGTGNTQQMADAVGGQKIIRSNILKVITKYSTSIPA